MWPNPIVTEVEPFDHFYIAEDYHQNTLRTMATRAIARSSSRRKWPSFASSIWTG